MANIQSNLNKIKNAVLGVDVRDSIHDGIKAINEEVENTTNRQVQLEGTFDELVINVGNSNTELLDIRIDIKGKEHETAGSAIREQFKKIDSYYELNRNVNIFEQDNYLVGYYIENSSSLGGYSILKASSGVGKIAVVNIKPNTQYSIVKGENTVVDGSRTMFIYATDSELFNQGDERRKIDGVYGRIYETKVTFTTTSTDNYLYIYFSDDVNSTEYIQVTEGVQDSFVSSELNYNPTEKLNVYNKDEIKEQVKNLNNHLNDLQSLYKVNEKINIFEQDNYLVGYYIENSSSLGGYSILKASSGVGKIAVVNIKPNTQYSIVKGENTVVDGSRTMFIYATDSELFNQGDERRKIDGVYGRIYETKVTFTTTSTDNYLYIYFSDDVNSTEYIQVTEGVQDSFVSSELNYNPTEKLNVYNKDEIKELLKSPNTPNKGNNILNYYIPCDKMKDYTIVDNTYNELLDLTSFNSAFDSLVDNRYVTKSVIGNEGSSNSYPINTYRFKPTSPIVANKTKSQVLPKLIITGCIHGSEKPSALALLNLCKNLKDKWQGNEFLTYLRFNVELIVVPVLNPWGYVNNRRGNFNHVDLNRNFDYKWANQGSTDSSSDNYRGTSANSEKETQAIINLVNSEKEGLIGLIDIHALGSGDTSWELLYRQEISNQENEDIFLQIASSNLSETTSKGIAECNIPIDISTQIGKIGIGYSSAAIDNYFNSQGINSSCCEVAYRYVDGINYHTDVNKLNTYFVATNIKNFINTFLYM